MKVDFRLTAEQQVLVINHMNVVEGVVKYSINVNENICGLGYDDLFQEGCLWLCRAAVTYDSERTKFATYAKTVVRNGLISYCRQMYAKHSKCCSMDLEEYEDVLSFERAKSEFESKLSLIETVDMLERQAKEYTGVAQKGTNALILKIHGVSTTDIATNYAAPVSHVSAWISRAGKKLKDDLKLAG